jgi:ABC-type transporter Mla subunit MlaD
MAETNAALGVFEGALRTLETGVKAIQDGWNKLLTAVQDFFDAINRKLSEDHWWNKVTEWFTDAIKDAIAAFQRTMAQVQQKFNEVFDKLSRALNGGTPVVSLFLAGSGWSGKVEPKLSGLPGDMKQEGDIDSWHGPAHDTYLAREGDQIAAVNQAVDEVKNVSRWVSGVATANVEFMTNLVTQVTPIINKLTETTGDVGAAAAAVDPLSAQEAANDMSATLGTVVEAIINYLSSLANRLATVINQVNDQATDTNDYRNFPGGHWPQAVNS